MKGKAMPKTLRQETPAFPKLWGKKFSEGDEIIFTHGLFDAHSHGRDNNAELGQGMTDILRHSVSQFSMALLMPNLKGKDALMTPSMAMDYYRRARVASRGQIKLLVTVYLNTALSEDDIKFIRDQPEIAGVKFYPAHGTTGAEFGLVTPLDAPRQLEWMEKYGVPLLVHGQTRTNPYGLVMDEWDREPYFYNQVAPKIDRRHPALRISYEHISTGVGAQTVVCRKGPTQGTFTPLHLGYTRTDVMDAGVRTDMVMKPMVQHARERLCLWTALVQCPDRFALGSDDAWHPTTATHAKNSACGVCYGPYRTGHYLDVFENEGALGLFGQFACINAANFYGVDIPRKTVVMKKRFQAVAETLPFGDHQAEPLHAGEERFGWYQLA